ncbi:MAG: radical SAM family heme chaperone HemW [Gemmatimonadota bacterium]|nr:radical SAM family heme chaperone HemW [Gemmatimonadota bacterium]
MTPTAVSSVYVHAPFCVRRCPYCDFAVQVRRVGDVEGWLAALAGELRAVEREGLFVAADRIRTVYVGGGTPSLLGPTAMEGVAALLGRERLGDALEEWTAEANPESLTKSVAAAWRRAGVDRLSIGIQSFHEPTLRWMGRRHGAEGAETAVRVARAAGFENLSVDLIFALPASTGRSWRDDLERTLALDAPHVSLYGLSVEPATPLGRAVAEGREHPVDEERYREEYLEAVAALEGAGYVHYEVSNFARPGWEAVHNSVYWDGSPYLGLGNGAHSFAPPVRRWNVRDWNTYRERTLLDRSPEESREVVTDGAEALEAIWLGLRTRRGLSEEGLGTSGAALAAAWEARGLATRNDGRVRLTAEGWVVLDHLVVELSEVVAP